MHNCNLYKLSENNQFNNEEPKGNLMGIIQNKMARKEIFIRTYRGYTIQ